MSEDPVKQGINWYVYGNNQPIRFIDPDGRAFIDWVQGGLDVVGLIPGVGEIADGANGVISLCRGDELSVALSFGAMIPFAGWFSTGAKTALKYGDEAVTVGKNIAEGVVKAIDTPTNRNGLRRAMEKISSKPFADAQAHHGLPWNYREWFAEKGLNVNDPKFGAWVKGGGNGGHQSWSKDYDKVWGKFIEENINATVEQIEKFYNTIRKNTQWGGGF